MDKPITISDQIKCVERELAMRGRVYPRWVEAGRMSVDAMNRELATMYAVLETLKQLQPQQESLF